MLMPKTAMNEDDLAELSENDVGTTGQIFSVQSVAVPKSKDEPTHEQLRSRVY